MKVFDCRIRFLTPAFLGDAAQNGRWRTPPIKALLRQFWRMDYVRRAGWQVDVARVRHDEGVLFGHAWLKDDSENGRKVAARKSAVRVRLVDMQGRAADAWGAGTQRGVEPLSDGLPTSYAWFGLIKRKDGQADRTGIKPTGGEGVRTLRLGVPDHDAPSIERVAQLVSAFGTLGSRSRGAWGSLHLDGVPELDDEALRGCVRPLHQCLKHDWAMSLAEDGNGICLWQSGSKYSKWEDAMKDVAVERRRVRSALKEPPDLRAALGFAGGGRMPSQLRWKVVPGMASTLAIRVFAMPHALPEVSKKQMSEPDLRSAWQRVCAALDQSTVFKRSPTLEVRATNGVRR